MLLLPGCSPEAKKTRYLERGDTLFEAGTLDGAEIEYLNVLKIESRDPRAIGQLGRIYLAQGRTLRALEFLRNAAELAPEDTGLRVQLGLTFLAVGQSTEARNIAREVLAEDPADDDAVLLLAEASVDPALATETREFLEGLSPEPRQRSAIQLALGSLSLRERDLTAAERYLQRALELDPESAIAYSALGALHRSQNDREKADQMMQRAYELAPPRSPQRLQYARFKLQTGDAAAAETILTEMTTHTPDFLPAWVARGEIAFNEQRYDDCETALKRILSSEPIHPDALFLSGRLYTRTGKYDEAATALEQLLEIFPRSTPALVQLAQVETLRGDPPKAITLLNQAIALDPNLPDAVFLLARVHMDRSDFSRAAESLRNYIAENPQDARAELILADTHVRQNRLDEALTIYRDIEKRFPDRPEPSYLAGMMLLRKNLPDQARLAFEESLSRATNYFPPLEQLVTLDLAENNAPAARERVTSRVASEPDRPEFRFLLGRVLIAEEAHDAAEAELLTTVQRWPEFRPALMLLAEHYTHSSREQEALTQLGRAVERNPDDAGALMLMAMIHDQLGNYPEARDAYEQVLKINPGQGAAINNLAYLYAEYLNEPERAYELALQARDLRPDDPHAADTLGWILVKRGDLAWATSLLQQSAAALPDAVEVSYHLGVALYLSGVEDRARTALARALELDTAIPESSDAQQRLAILAIDPVSATPEQKENLQSRLESHPDDTIALIRLAAIHELAGALPDARKTYQTLAQARPNYVNGLIAQARFQAWKMSDRAAGWETARKAYELAPENPAVTGLLGRITLETGDFERAVVLLRDTVRRTAGTPEVQHALAWAEFGVGRLDEAQAAMRKVIDGSPALPLAEDARLFLDLLQIEAETTDPAAIRTQAESVLRDRPDYGPALWLRATTADRINDADNAVSDYEALLRLYPSFLPAKIKLAELYAASPTRLEEAFGLASEARRARPDDPTVARVLGRIEYLRGNYSRAAILLDESRNRLPDTARSLFYLGMAQHHQGKQPEGMALLRQALEAGLDAGLAAEAREVVDAAPAP